MRLPHVSPNVTLDITEDYNRRGSMVIAQCVFDGEKCCVAFPVHGGAPVEYARSKLDELAMEIGRRFIYGRSQPSRLDEQRTVSGSFAMRDRHFPDRIR